MKIFEEMKQFGVKPTEQTFICLLSAHATAGRLERVYATHYVVQVWQLFFQNIYIYFYLISINGRVMI